MMADGWLVSHEEVVEADQGQDTWRVNTQMRRRVEEAEIRIPLGLRKDQMEPVEEILEQDPMLKESLQEIMGKQLAAGTMSNYQSAVIRFQNFCETVEQDYTDISEKIVIHYVAELNRQKVSYGILCQVKPALVLLEEMFRGKSDSFTARADRMLEGAKRVAAERRPTVKKAREVTLELLKGLVSNCDEKADHGKVDIYELRTVFKLVIIYFTLCRFSDYQKLQARHFSRKGDDMLIVFPTAKNDQMHRGQVTVVKGNGSEFCPVKLAELYFHQLQLRMGEENQDKRYVYCRIRKVAGRWTAATGQAASASKARESLQVLLKKAGCETKGVTAKSFKMLGVTKMMEAGMTAEEVAIHGRWRSKDMPLRYKHNSDEYKTGVAAKIPV